MERKRGYPGKASAMISSVPQDSTHLSSHLLNADLTGSDRQRTNSFSLNASHKKFAPYFKANPLTLKAEGCMERADFQFSNFPLMVFKRSSTVPHSFVGLKAARSDAFILGNTHGSLAYQCCLFCVSCSRCNFRSSRASAAPLFWFMRLSAFTTPHCHSNITNPLYPLEVVQVFLLTNSPGQLRESKGACFGREVAMFVSLKNSWSSTCCIRLSLYSACVLSEAINNVKHYGNSVPRQAKVNPMGWREVALTVEQQRER